MQKQCFIDFTSVVESVTRVSRLLGVWSGTEPFFTKNLYSIYSICILAIFNLFFVVQVAYWFFGNVTFETIMWSATALFEQILTDFKVYVIIANQGMLKRLAVSINRDIFQPKNEKQKQLAEPTLREFEIFYKFFLVAVTMAASLMLLFPLIDGVVSKKEAYLPYVALYPYNSTKYFTISYTHQAISVLLMSAIQINVDCLSFCLIAIVGIQCDMLADSLRNIAVYTKEKIAKNDATEQCFSVEMENSIRNCIEHHKQILSYFDQIYGMLNTLLMAQYASSGISICCTLFQLSTIDSLRSKYLSMILYCISILSQLLLYCWWGDIVIKKSEQLPYAAFESDWVDTSRKYKCSLLIFIHRTQKPLMLYALDYFTLSLQSFMMILRNAYSFFAVLHRMNT